MTINDIPIGKENAKSFTDFNIPKKKFDLEIIRLKKDNIIIYEDGKFYRPKNRKEIENFLTILNEQGKQLSGKIHKINLIKMLAVKEMEKRNLK